MVSGRIARENVRIYMSQLATHRSVWVQSKVVLADALVAFQASLEQFTNALTSDRNSPGFDERAMEAKGELQQLSLVLEDATVAVQEIQEQVNQTKILLDEALKEVKGQRPSNWIHFVCSNEINFVLESQSDGVSFSNTMDSSHESIGDRDFYLEVEPSNPESFRIHPGSNSIQLELKYSDGDAKVIQIMTDDLEMFNYLKIGTNGVTGNVTIQGLKIQNQ